MSSRDRDNQGLEIPIQYTNTKEGKVWWHTPFIPARRRCRQADRCEFWSEYEVPGKQLGYTVILFLIAKEVEKE